MSASGQICVICIRLKTRYSAGRLWPVLREETSGRADCRDSPILQENDVVGDPPGVFRLMRDEKHGHAPLGLHAHEQIEHILAQRRAERGEGLVEQQHRAVADEHAGERDALALAARQFARQALSLPARPVRDSASATACRSAGVSRSAGERPSPTFFSTSRWAKRLFSWKTMDTGRSAGGKAVTSTPPIRMRPDRGVSKPATRLSRVDFPDPLGPMIAVIDEAAISASNSIAALP